jgi:molecular chaperone DnaK
MGKQLISKAVGIDLGTTNSAVAIMQPADNDIIIHSDPRTRSRRETTPSCVWKDPRNQQKIVGSKAFQRIGGTPEPIRSIKRSMGKQISVRLGDEMVTPEEASSMILQEMKRQIEEDVAQFSSETSTWIVDRAIVTVPAYFDQPQIEATRKAAEMIGLKTLELLHEPTAAASYYCWQNQVQNGTFLVYDFGGGTFDVSILRCTEGTFEVLGINGNNRLGGDDIDAALAEELRQRLVSEGYALDLDPKIDPEDRHRFDKLKLLAESVKKALSTEDEFILRSQSGLQDKAGQSVNIDMPFERYEIEDIMRPIVERTIPYCYQALELARQKAGVMLTGIDAIILAGGTTHIPLVREMVRKTFCADPAVAEPRAKCAAPVYKKVDTIVALGAAIRAAATGGLEIYNPERTLRVSFRGTGSTASQRANIGGKVEALIPELDITNGYIRLRIDELGYQDEQDLKKGGVFGFTRVPLQARAENLLTCEIFSGNGKRMATLSRSLFQSEVALRPTGGSSGTASISKALYLEVSHDGKPYRKELIKALTTLPASKDDVFYHPGDTQRLRLPLYQQKKMIKEIVIDDLPYLPKGTPIDFTLYVDELAGITVEGHVGEKTFETQIDPPPERRPPTPAEAQALEESFQKALEALPGEKRRYIEEQQRKARESYEAAVKRDDIEQSIHEFEEIEELFASITQTEESLQPPREVFEQLVGDCLSLNQYLATLHSQVDQVNQPHNAGELIRAINAQQIRGEQAFAARDQTGYADALMALFAIRDHLSLQYQKIVQGQDTRTESEKAAGMVKNALAEVQEIEQMAAACKRPDFQSELILIRSQVNATARDIQSNPLLVEHRIRQIWSRMQQIKNVLHGSSDDSGDGKLVEDHSS